MSKLEERTPRTFKYLTDKEEFNELLRSKYPMKDVNIITSIRPGDFIKCIEVGEILGIPTFRELTLRIVNIMEFESENTGLQKARLFLSPKLH